jgi:DNA mismatch endonuclease (patch repair protein)
MTDNVSPEHRARMMSAVKGKNTEPELFVRRALYANGFRYRLHYADLPGRPDVVLPKYNVVVFVNGCFWHGHRCRRGLRPKTRMEFWNAKIGKNIERDRAALAALRRAGWRAVTIWTCELAKRTERLIAELHRRPVKRRSNSRDSRRKTPRA